MYPLVTIYLDIYSFYINYGCKVITKQLKYQCLKWYLVYLIKMCLIQINQHAFFYGKGNGIFLYEQKFTKAIL